ncbi:hypothetical protein CQA38_06800 [Campylobacter sp. MIT 12-5580]|uniref:hypothetical protein n=1 Tax=Campylobacter sp. MIT 12-5580 TaxID=2040651 RepID=UPI0010F6164C|nr:hypothetical protein [Campylobacter sp. MIT 12-5580]TKX28585.1 hypothetical protein CQA38_06800 [Campylobacter sp. MIT 12-5580]
MKNKISRIALLIAFGCLSFTYASDNLECNSAQDCKQKAEFQYYKEKPNYQNYIKYLEKRCYKFKQCYELGSEYLKGEFVEKNYKKAVELMEPHCEVDRTVPCDTVADLYARGDKYLQPNPHIARIYSDITKYYKKLAWQASVCKAQIENGVINPNDIDCKDIIKDYENIKANYSMPKEH